MPSLKIGILPDRTPVKYTFSAWPDLAAALDQYAEAYRITYGHAESVAELIPFMLAAFLKSDRGFAKANRGEPGSDRALPAVSGAPCRPSKATLLSNAQEE